MGPVAPSLPVVVALAAVVFSVLWSFIHRYVIKPFLILRRLRAQGVPGYPFRPLVGQLPEMAKLRRQRGQDPAFAASTRASEFLFVGTRRWGPLWTWSLGHFPRLVLADPALARLVLASKSDNFVKSDLTRYFTLLGDGLVTANGALWAQQRRLVNPAFHMREIQRLVPVMVQQARDAVRDWQARVLASPGGGAGGVFAADRELGRVTLRIISETAFGMEMVGERAGDLEALLTAFGDYFSSAARARVRTAANPLYTWLPTQLNRRMWRAERYIRRTMLQIIRDRRRQSQSCAAGAQGRADGEVAEGSSRHGEKEAGFEKEDGRVDLLQLMLMSTGDPEEGGESAEGAGPAPTSSSRRDTASLGEAGQQAAAAGDVIMSEQQLMDECVTFLAAGHETTAGSLMWTMMLLASHPDWQERAREEVRGAAAGCSDWAPSLSNLNQLKVLNSVLLESLRLYPPAVAVIRTCAKETRLTGTVSVPAGCDIFVPIEVIHQSPEFWGESADCFDPGRFAEGVGKAASVPGAFMGFGLGPRSCIGQNFAMAEAKVILAFLLLKFQWKLSDTYRHHPVVGITMSAKHGMNIVLEPVPAN